MNERGELIRAVARVVPEYLFETVGGRDHCVMSCAIARTFLRKRGISVKLIGCRVLAANAEAWEAAGREPEGLLRLEADAHPRAKIVAVGFSEDALHRPKEVLARGSFPGHVVMTTRNPDMLVDPTLSQFSRPEHGIDFENSVLAVEMPRYQLQGFERHEDGLQGELGDGAGAILWNPDPTLDPRLGMGWEDSAVREYTSLLEPVFDRKITELIEAEAADTRVTDRVYLR